MLSGELSAFRERGAGRSRRQDFFMKSKSMSRESPHALFSTEGGICSQTPVHAPIVLPVQIGISPVFWGQGVL